MGNFVLVEKRKFTQSNAFYDHFKKYCILFPVIIFNILELIIGLLSVWFSKEANQILIFYDLCLRYVFKI